jgi:DNA-binding IclR family transcriptional regulator
MNFLSAKGRGRAIPPGQPLVLSDLYLSGHTLLSRFDAVLDALVEEFGFVGYAGVLSGTDIIVLRLKPGNYPLRFVLDAGQRVPAERTAIGRSLLARKPDAEAIALVGQHGQGRAARATLLTELARIRRKGWATIESAIIPGIAAVGAAIGDPARGEALGFALSYPKTATDESLRARMARRVRDAALSIGARLGDPFWVAIKAAEIEAQVPRAVRSARKAHGATT